MSSSPACTRSSRLALAAARSTAPSPACLARSQAPTAADNELIELPAAARAAGGQALTEPKLEHFCIAFCRTRRAERRAAAAPARRAHPSRCARHSNPRPAAGSERRPHTRESRRAARAPQPQAARMPSLHIRIPSFARPQLSSWTRRLALSAPCRRRRRRRLSRRHCHRAPLLPRAAPPRACERRAISGCGGPFGCVSRVSRPRARGVPHRNNTRVTTPIHSESLTSSNLRRASTVPRRSLRSRLRLAIGLCSQPAARQRRRRLLGRQVGDE